MLRLQTNLQAELEPLAYSGRFPQGLVLVGTFALLLRLGLLFAFGFAFALASLSRRSSGRLGKLLRPCIGPILVAPTIPLLFPIARPPWRSSPPRWCRPCRCSEIRRRAPMLPAARAIGRFGLDHPLAFLAFPRNIVSIICRHLGNKMIDIRQKDWILRVVSSTYSFQNRPCRRSSPSSNFPPMQTCCSPLPSQRPSPSVLRDGQKGISTRCGRA